MKREEATKFLVWRSYHKLEDDLGRPPIVAEVAKDVGITKGSAYNQMKKLKSVEIYDPGAAISISRKEKSWGYGPKDLTELFV